MRSATLYSSLCALVLADACVHHLEIRDTPPTNERQSTPGEAVRTAITNVRIFEGNDFSLPTTLCIDGGYITSLKHCDNSTHIVNGAGKYMIPGLIDSHLHLTDVQSVENLTSYGCTTAFNMNCRNYTQCDMIRHQPGLANVFTAGRSSVGNNSAHSKQDPTRPKSTLIYPNTNVTEFVEWQLNNGSDFHKRTAEINGPSLQQQIEMVKVARYQYNKPAMTHAADLNAYQQAIDSNTDGIQHVPQDGLLEYEQIAKIKAQGQSVTPTLNIFTFGYTDPTLQRYFGAPSNNLTGLYLAQQNARNLYLAGVPILAGTDASGTVPVGNMTATVPYGKTLHWERQNLVEIVGMSPAEAINAATREAAAWHRVPDRGVIGVQKRADLVLLNSNPLVNISNTLDIERVWVKGVEVGMLAVRRIEM